MPYDELLKWNEYFKRRPSGWQDDLRAAYIMRSMGVDKEPQEIFMSLEPIFKVESENPEQLNIRQLKASSLFQKMMRATGGDKIKE